VVERDDSTAGGGVHVEEPEMVCGPPGALVASVTFPLQAPVKGAASITLRVQPAPGANSVGQLSVWATAPLTVMLAMLSAAVPVLVNVTVCGRLVVPAACAGKFSWLADKEAIGVDAVPKPANLTVSGLFWVLPVTVIEPLWSPADVGLKVTVTVQLFPGASVAPHVLVSEKGPLAAMPAMFATPLAVLNSAKLCGPLAEPAICVPKLRLGIDEERMGPPSVMK
jgi:hypothetical protein